MNLPRIRMPVMVPHSVDNPSLNSYASAQSIIQIKELEVDRVRYDQYKLWIKKPMKEGKKR